MNPRIIQICWHECPGETCVAFYEPETGLCYRGCEGELLAVGLIAAITLVGWQVLETTAQVKGISAWSLLYALRQLRALAINVPHPPRQRARPERVQEVVIAASRAIELLEAQVLSRPQRLRPKLSFEWGMTSVAGALQVMLGSIPPYEGMQR